MLTAAVYEGMLRMANVAVQMVFQISVRHEDMRLESCNARLHIAYNSVMFINALVYTAVDFSA